MSIYSTIIDSQALSALMEPTNVDALLILDCRSRLGAPDWGRSAYQEGHLPGARHIDLDLDLAAAPGADGRHPLPEQQDLAARLRELGLSDHTQAVVYDDAGGAFAARAWWCLRWLGHRATAVLDGGMPAWLSEHGNQLETRPAPQATTGDFQVGSSLTQVVEADGVLELVQQPNTATALLDARAQARFSGDEEPIDPVAGHIPGAQCRPFTNNLTSDGLFKDPAILRAEFAELPAQLVCYCGSGVTAAHNILALVHAGLPEPALYPGSWSGWITDSSRPIVTR